MSGILNSESEKETLDSYLKGLATVENHSHLAEDDLKNLKYRLKQLNVNEFLGL